MAEKRDFIVRAGIIVSSNANVNTAVLIGNSTVNTIVNSTSFSGTANNALNVNGKAEIALNVNNALTANTTTYVNNKAEIALNVNNALTSNNSSFLNGNSAANLQSYADDKAANAYSNAVSYANNLRLDSVTNTSVTFVAVANSVKTAYDAAIVAQGMATNAYSNSVTYTNNRAANAYSNAVAYTDIAAANTYSNAVVFASNATNINVGTLAEARLPYRMDQNVRTTDSVTFGNLVLTGSLSISGNVNVVGANTLSVVDNFIYLNANNTVDNEDIGIVGNYNDGTYRHAGIFRDASDGFWKVFDSYEPEPDANVNINTTNTTFHLANFQANTLILGNTSVNWFTANDSVVNATAFYVGNTLIGNSVGPYGKAESTLNVNSASLANNSSYLGGLIANGYQTTAGLSANVATLTSNNATYAFGKQEIALNVNNALTANNSGYLNGNTASDLQTYADNKAANAYSNAVVFAANATNINVGTLAEARLPYRMNQDVRTSDSVTFANGTFTSNLTSNDTITSRNLNVTKPTGFTVGSVSSNTTTVQFFADDTYTYGGVLSSGSAIFGSSGSYAISLRQNGVDNLYLAANGNLGVSNTTPANKLSVTGTAFVSGNTTVDSNFYSQTTTNKTLTVSIAANNNLSLDLSQSNFFNCDLDKNITSFTLTNVPTSVVAFFIISFAVKGSYTISWPASFKWKQGTTPTLSAFANDTQTFIFYTTDGGTTVQAFDAGYNR